MSKMRAAGLSGLVTFVAACGGGNGNDDGGGPNGPPAYTIAEVPFAVDGTEPELVLSNADAVLAAALSATLGATSVTTGNLGSFDRGRPPPGNGSSPCTVGSINEAVAASGAQRTVTLTASQCFNSAAGNVQNGVAELVYTQPAAGQAQGSLSFGSPSSSFTFSLSDPEDPDFIFRQGRGPITFQGDFDGAPVMTRVRGFSLILGKGPLPTGGAAFTPNRQIELRIGAAALDFTVTSDVAAGTSGNDSVNFSGPVFMAGTGAALVPGCAFRASYSAVTNSTLSIGQIDRIARGGMLTLSTSAGSATVLFGSDGSATVNTGSGTPQTYPVNVVRSFCGIF